MKLLKHLFKLILLVAIMSSFSQCSSAQKLQEKAPTTFGDVYCKKWVSGVAEGPSGLDIFIEVKDANFLLDSVYFRGKAAKLVKNTQNKKQFIGRFVASSKYQQDMIVSSEAKAEYGNKMPEKPIKIPFQLQHNECVITYKNNGKTKYYKLTNVIEKRSIDVPMSPASNNN